MAIESIRTLPANQHVKNFSPFNAAAYTVQPGEHIRVETLCAASGAIRETVTAPTNDELYTKSGWIRGMPMTGPIAVEGAEPGDALAIHIHDIEFDDYGWTVAQPDRGAAGELIETAEVRVLPIKDDYIDFGGGIHLPFTPMIGAIGTAPAEEEIGSGLPGAHGGNLDCTLIKPNTTLYLPVNVPGALLGLGDLHAAMGDGEVGMAGLEVNGAVTMHIQLIKQTTWPLPLIDTGTTVSTIVSDEDLNLAARGSVQAMVTWIEKSSSLNMNESNMLVSLVGDVRICQIVNPLMTCRLDMPKRILEQLGISFEGN